MHTFRHDKKLQDLYKSDTKPVSASKTKQGNISDKFWDVLQLSFRTVLLEQKKQITEVSNQKIKILEKKVDKLYETVMNSEETNYDDIVALATSYYNPEFNQYLYKAIDLYLRYTMENIFINPLATYSIRLDIEDKDCTNSMLSLWTLYSKSLHYSKTNFFLHLQDDFITTMHYFLVDQWTIAVKYPLDVGLFWAGAVNEVAEYFLSNFRFTEARNNLAAAEYMLKTLCQKEILKLPEDNPRLDYKEILRLISAFNTSLWGLYGILLLQLSINHLSYPQYFQQKKTYKIDESELVSSIMSKKSAKLLLFMNLEENLKDITNKVTDILVSNLQDATLVFNHSVKYFIIANTSHNSSKNEISFKLQNYIDYYISLLHKYLTFFETDRNKRMQLYREQIHILLIIYDTNYEIPNIISNNDVFRILSFELIVAYANLINMIIEDDEVFEKKAEEIVKFLNNSIKCYQAFLYNIYVKLE
ncbi:hypothetical protein HN011_011478 [Eciton burchellii]|nr:hypothetical protein HN011_011478 [Eciton burchellii]